MLARVSQSVLPVLALTRSVALFKLCHTLEDPDGSGEVVDPPGGTQGGGADGRRGDEIVGEGVVQVALVVGGRSVSPTLLYMLVRCPGYPQQLRWWWLASETYLQLEDILDVVELLLVSVVGGHQKSAIGPSQCHQPAQLALIDLSSGYDVTVVVCFFPRLAPIPPVPSSFQCVWVLPIMPRPSPRLHRECIVLTWR